MTGIEVIIFPRSS